MGAQPVLSPASAALLFTLGQLLAWAIWLAMILAPRSVRTVRLVEGRWYLLALGGVFAALLADGLAQVDPWRALLSGVGGTVERAHENLALLPLAGASWTHYTAIDLFLGRWMFLRARHRGAELSALLALSFAAAPAGLIAYFAWERWRSEA